MVLTVSENRRPPRQYWRLATLMALAFCYFLPMHASAQEDLLAGKRQQMVDVVRQRGVSDLRVLDAMGRVPRHLFVPEKVRPQAYEDFPLPIGSQQTISQPYIVALMTSLLDLRGGEKVLEIGTGSGYQAAVLSKIAGEVYTIEILGRSRRAHARRSAGWATTTSTSGSATATPAGRKRRRSTPSW